MGGALATAPRRQAAISAAFSAATLMWPPSAPLMSTFSTQALAIREMGSYVCELERVGKGLPTFHFDRWALAAGIGRVAPSLQAQLPQQAT